MFRIVLTLLVVFLAVQAFAKTHEQKENSEKKKTDDCTHCGKVFTKAFDSYANLTYTTQLEKLRSACESIPIRNRQALSNMCLGLVGKIEETKEELVDSKNHKAACKKLGVCSSDVQVEQVQVETKSKDKKPHNKDENKKHHDKDENNKPHNKSENKHHDKESGVEGKKHHNKESGDEDKKHHKHPEDDDDDDDDDHKVSHHKHHGHHEHKHGDHENKHGHHDNKHGDHENKHNKNGHHGHHHGDHKNKHHGHHNKHHGHHGEKHTNCNREERFTCFRSCEDVDRLMLQPCRRVSVPAFCAEESAEWECPGNIHGHNVSYISELECPVPEYCQGPRQLGKVCVNGQYWVDRQVLSSVFTPENIRYGLAFGFVSFFVFVLAIFYRCVVCYSSKKDEDTDEKVCKYKAVADLEDDTASLTQKL